ncbi:MULTISPECIES: hypothetical protein [Mycolicibacter]|uniref:Uncharacterized protein n=1 Tax=Mycolicibacter longobardus TaxID=1108812 RepID=A0A1X1YBP6_9MYCO|nr:MULTISPECIES: hypothetical protein [Mycolicibacter]ORW08476.1 hypothetical protein AWC16_18925 [Mycolicibacter longobardus]RAV04415.1 hypothetical protein DQP56_00945 [Mycolicibacter senuensis]
MARQRTRFELCDVHRGWDSDGRYRLAEIFCEGGPASGPPCSPQPCRAFPGTDFFNSSVTDDDAAEWVRNWAVNTR